MAKGKIGRPRKRGRPKGSKNKVDPLFMAYDKGWKTVEIPTNDPNLKDREFALKEITKTVDLKSRLDECVVNLENAVAEAIAKLKASI